MFNVLLWILKLHNIVLDLTDRVTINVPRGPIMWRCTSRFLPFTWLPRGFLIGASLVCYPSVYVCPNNIISSRIMTGTFRFWLHLCRVWCDVILWCIQCCYRRLTTRPYRVLTLWRITIDSRCRVNLWANVPAIHTILQYNIKKIQC